MELFIFIFKRQVTISHHLCNPDFFPFLPFIKCICLIYKCSFFSYWAHMCLLTIPSLYPCSVMKELTSLWWIKWLDWCKNFLLGINWSKTKTSRRNLPPFFLLLFPSCWSCSVAQVFTGRDDASFWSKHWWIIREAPSVLALLSKAQKFHEDVLGLFHSDGFNLFYLPFFCSLNR